RGRRARRETPRPAPAPAARRLAEARGLDFPASVRPCSLARTTPRASCLALGVLSLVSRGPQHTPYPYIYQMISVCANQSQAILVFAGFSKGAVERVFRMPVPEARRCIPKVGALSIICRRVLAAPVRQVLIVFCKPAGSPRARRDRAVTPRKSFDIACFAC